MIRGGRFLFVGASLAMTGCTTTHPVEVRAIPDPSAKYHYSGGLLAEARGQLAVGAVGTALETFRKLQREQPASPDAFAGIAACYAAMGRFDLERQNYEFALAYAPHDRVLLSALASSLERQGETAQALEIRQEIAQLSVPAPAVTQVAQATAVPMAVPHMGSVTVKLPPVDQAVLKPVTLVPEVQIAASSAPEDSSKSKPQLAPVPVTMPVPHASPKIDTSVSTAPAVALADMPTPSNGLKRAADVRIEIPAADQAPAPIMPTARLGSVAVELPPLQRGTLRPATFKNDARLAAEVSNLVEAPAAPMTARSEALDPAQKPRQPKTPELATSTRDDGPYLQRLSRGEVALVTSRGPIWRAPAIQVAVAMNGPSRAPQTERVAALALGSSVKWVPLAHATGRPTIQLLNAARKDGLAASTRTALVNRGWRKIGIGNARTVREHSLVLYSPPHAVLGRRLAAQFGCRAVKVQGVDKIMVLLGRDAGMRKASTSRA